jgi:hypothetical protein
MKETAMGIRPSSSSEKENPNSRAFLSSSSDTEICPKDIVTVAE